MCRLGRWTLVGLLLAATAAATPHVPVTWRASTKLVPALTGTPFAGQAKRTTWSRDANHDFIDDIITQRFSIGQDVNVAVALSQALAHDDVVVLLSPFGSVRHVGENLAFALVDDVAFADLPALAALPEVAMIEWQVPVYGMTDLATRNVHARAACTSVTSADCGAGVNVAVVDYGVADGIGTVFGDRFEGGYDPYIAGSPTDGTFNPAADGLTPHGTVVAAILLGAATPGVNCRPVGGSAQFSSDCRGVAPAAGLVDVKACRKQGMSDQDLAHDGECPELMKSIDWLSSHAAGLGVRVASISLGTCFDDPGPGDGILDQLVDLLVSRGVTVVVAGGNAVDPCSSLVAGVRAVGEPASASMAITVGQRDDIANLDPSDDAPGSTYLIGPRADYAASRNPLALKPDLVAPSQGLRVSVPAAYDAAGQILLDGSGQPIREASGSSIAAPQVGSSRVDLQACKLEYSIVSPK